MASSMVKASGIVGEIYTQCEGGYIMPMNDRNEEDAYDEGTFGWYQKDANTRVLVQYKRVSHSVCMWKEDEQL